MDHALVSLNDVICKDGSTIGRKCEKGQLQLTMQSHRKENEIRRQTTFMVDPDAIQFMDREYREAYTCHINPTQVKTL